MPPPVPAAPNPDPTPAPGQQPSEGLEAACRRSLSRLGRRPAPERLRRVVLAAAWVASEAGACPSGAAGSRALEGGSALRRSPALRAGPGPRASWRLPAAAAALLLLSLCLATSKVSPPAAASACLAARAEPRPAPRSFAVVDDPSVPLFHDVETFDRLAVVLPGPAPR